MIFVARSIRSKKPRRPSRDGRLGPEPLERRDLLAADAVATFRAGLNFGDPGLAEFWNASVAEKSAIRKAAESVVQDRIAKESAEMIVRLPTGVTAAEFAAARGLEISYTFRSDDRIVVLKAASTEEASRTAKILSAAQGVEFLGFNLPTANERFGVPFTPNDPYFPRNQPSSGWPGQWHLSNPLNPGRDARVTGAWTAGFTGQGVTIGIVDDGLQTDHPDLSPNYSASSSYDFGSNDAIPNPVNSNDNHGTSVAGVAAARGGNGIGVTGAAPYATLAGLRVPFDNTQTSAMLVDATLYRSSGADTTIKIKNHSYGYRAPYVITTGTTQEVQAVATSTAAGTIHVFAAGNDRVGFFPSPDSNKKHSQSDPNVITVAAFGSDGTYAHYSSFGANVFVTAPSSSDNGVNNATHVTTTDRTGSNGYNPNDPDSFPDQAYTSVFGGTSSAAPLVSGVLAIVKEAQPALNTRLAKHLLAKTSDVVDAGDSTVTGGGDGTTTGSAWKTNAAGLKFNMNYGFGLIDAAELVSEATKYSGVTPLQTFGSGTLVVNAPLDDFSSVTRTTSVNVSGARPLEEVVVALDVTHSYRGDVEAFLTSPSGTTGRLVLKDGNDRGANFTWSFTTNAFWGESPNGTWTVRVADAVRGDTGTWNSWSLNLRMGELIPAVFEPNDSFTTMPFLGVTAEMGLVTVGGTIGDGVWGSRDVDLAEIYLSKNQRVTVEVRARRLPVASTLDSYLRLFSGSGKELAKNDDAFGLDSRLSYVAKKAGVYVIGISGWRNTKYNPKKSGSGRDASTGVYEMDVQILNRSPRSATAAASTAAFESGIFAAYASYALEGQSKQPARRPLGGR